MGSETRAAERLRVLAAATSAFAEATTDAEALLEIIGRKTADVIQDQCAVYLLDESSQRLEPVTIHSVVPGVAEKMRGFFLDSPLVVEEHPLVVRALERNEPLLIAKVDPDALRARTTLPYTKYLIEHGIHSILVAPLRAHGASIGILSLVRFRATSPAYDEDDLELAKALAAHAGIAISNARAYRAVETARRAAEEAARALRESEEKLLLTLEEKRQSDDARRLAEIRFTKLSEAGVIGVIVANLDTGKVLEINDTLATMVGYDREEILSGRVDWLSMTAPESLAGDLNAKQQLDAHGTSSLREKRYRHRDGSFVPALVASTVTNPAKREVIAFVLDISERKAAEARMTQLTAEHAAEARFRELIEVAPDAMLVVDTQGTIELANAAAERMFGYERRELLGRPVELLVPARLHAEQRAHRDTYESGEYSRTRELVGLSSDGSEIPIEVTLSTFRSAERLLVTASIRDISARRRVERELVRAKELAETASQELEAFSYSVAHDLRAPLRGMNGFSQLLLDKYGSELDDEGRDWLREIASNTTKMARLIDGLLSLSRLTRLTLRRERFDLSAMAEEVVKGLSGIDPRPHMELSIEPNLEVLADPNLVRPLLENLLANAWKFTARVTAPRVELASAPSPSGGPRVYFVRDNGAGFDMAYKSKLFGAFQRLHSPRDFPGTGIGLATAQRIVQRHGGHIWAEGYVGHGATFYFTLAGSPAQSQPDGGNS